MILRLIDNWGPLSSVRVRLETCHDIGNEEAD